MIRDGRPEDIPALVAMVAKDDHTPAAYVEQNLRTYRLLVEEEPGSPDDAARRGAAPAPPGDSILRGFACTLEDEPDDFNLRVFVGPAWRRRGLGGALLERALEGLRETRQDFSAHPGEGPPGSGSVRGGPGRLARPARVTARYRADKGEARAFYAHRGFEVWYAMDELVYRGGLPTGTSARSGDLVIRPYEDRFFPDYIRVMADAFRPVRQRKGFEPWDVFDSNNNPERRKWFADHAADLFVGFVGGTLVAEAAVDGDFIDEVAVAPAHQGKGYGRALTEFCMNLLAERGHAHSRTSVLVDNLPARKLYYGLGFQLVQTNEWACRRLGL